MTEYGWFCIIFELKDNLIITTAFNHNCANDNCIYISNMYSPIGVIFYIIICSIFCAYNLHRLFVVTEYL